ncbi:MAG: cation-translocating P-type ATPase [Victivallales bacterium]|nr:cation-translocating P-type ATPase [Victivallales bacterium]
MEAAVTYSGPDSGHALSTDGRCRCPHCMTEGAGHNRSMARLSTALLGGALILNSYLLRLLFPDQLFASELSAMAGAVVLTIPIFTVAFKDLVAGHVHMNELVALAILAAMTRGDFASAGLIAFLLLLGIIIESRTASGAQRSIEELIKLAPHSATLLKDGKEIQVDVLDLGVGDTIVIRPGENFPVDGKIVKGQSTVNQASITGESLPIDKEKGDDVFAGTQNLTGALEVKVSKVGEDTTLGKVQELILAAEKTQAPIVRMIDKYAGYYTPTILMIAGLTWWFTKDMNNVVAVLIVSCPCALVLATPTAIVASVAAASRLGILIKNVADIEVAAKIQAFIFDKTGTLTEGKLSVARLAPAKGVEPAELLQAAITVESHSNHPVATALKALADETGLSPEPATKATEFHGKGVEAVVGKKIFRAGREAWLKSFGTDFSKIEKSDDAGMEKAMSVIFVAVGDKVLGWIGFRDTVRKEAAGSIRRLGELGIKFCAMVTGDRKSVGALIANELNIHDIEAECLPDGKVDYVLRTKRDFNVAVVGDGVNDAPALASGTLGIAMGAIGSDIAINSASIALMNNDLRRIPMLIQLSRQSWAVMYQNIALGVLFVIGGISLSVFGLLPPIAAAMIHTLSTLVIVFNSARLVRIGEELTRPETVESP